MNIKQTACKFTSVCRLAGSALLLVYIKHCFSDSSCFPQDSACSAGTEYSSHGYSGGGSSEKVSCSDPKTRWVLYCMDV